MKIYAIDWPEDKLPSFTLPNLFRRGLDSGAGHQDRLQVAFDSLAYDQGSAPGASIHARRSRARDAVEWAYHPNADGYPTRQFWWGFAAGVLDDVLSVADGIDVADSAVDLALASAALTGVGGGVIVALGPVIAAVEAAGLMSSILRPIVQACRDDVGLEIAVVNNEVASLAALRASFAPLGSVTLWEPHPRPALILAVSTQAVNALIDAPKIPLVDYLDKLRMIIEGDDGPLREALVWATFRVEAVWLVEVRDSLRRAFPLA